MTVLAAQTLRRIRPVDPFCERTVFQGMTYGVGPASYDVRCKESLLLPPSGRIFLASTIEHFAMGLDFCAEVKDKSTWVRRGLCVQNTFLDPGWTGFLTLELSNHGHNFLEVTAGMPIAHIVFHWLDEPTMEPYHGKYMNQPSRPVSARDD